MPQLAHELHFRPSHTKILNATRLIFKIPDGSGRSGRSGIGSSPIRIYGYTDPPDCLTACIQALGSSLQVLLVR